MDGAENRFGAAHVLAWSTVLLGFGLIQGTLYLKGYWAAFGLDPFQFGEASDLALVGLTGVGVTVAFMMLAAAVGGYLADKVRLLEEKLRIRPWVAGLIFVGLLVAFTWLVSFGWLLLSGMLLTWSLIWLAHRTPVIPDTVRQLKLLPYVALAIAYIPMGAYYLGQRNADHLKTKVGGFTVSTNEAGGCGSGGWRFVGRLSDIYVLFCRQSGSVSILPAGANAALLLQNEKSRTQNK